MIYKSNFQAPLWARNPHAQTILASKIRRFRFQSGWEEEFNLPDGDFLDLWWSEHPEKCNLPLVVLFHGLEGSANSNYIIGIQAALLTKGFNSVVMHFRGCSGRPNRKERGYHSGETTDARYFIKQLRSRFPTRFIGAIGYSLGGNMLAKYLGEEGSRSPLSSAAIVCAPLDLAACSHRIARGFSRQYQRYLLNSLKVSIERKRQSGAFKHFQVPHPHVLRAMSSFVEFDDLITGPLHGFKGAADYYLKCSAKTFVSKIRTPTLIIHAKDDPFMTDRVIPSAKIIPDCVRYELSEHGGHVGFVFGTPWAPRYWLEERLPEWISDSYRQFQEQTKRDT